VKSKTQRPAPSVQSWAVASDQLAAGACALFPTACPRPAGLAGEDSSCRRASQESGFARSLSLVVLSLCDNWASAAVPGFTCPDSEGKKG